VALLFQIFSSNDLLGRESKLWHQLILVVVPECCRLYELGSPPLCSFVTSVIALDVVHDIKDVGQAGLVDVLGEFAVEVGYQRHHTTVRA